MNDKQTTAQIQCAPEPRVKRSQQQRILDTIRKQGFITSWGAIHDQLLHCTKLSTRIGEIERKYGHEFVHESLRGSDNRITGTKYYLPQGMTMEQFTNKTA